MGYKIITALFIAATLACFINPVFSQSDETITVTTFYPSPYGVYNELRLNPHSPYTTECTASEEGLLFYDNDPADAAQRGLKVCKDSMWQLIGGGGSEAPQGAVMFFKLPSCPSGWSELKDKDGNFARGRYIVAYNPANPPSDLGAAVGQALTNKENRPAGAHTHNVSGVGIYAFETMSGNGQNGYAVPQVWMASANLVTDVGGFTPGTNAPYIQLLACQKD